MNKFVSAMVASIAFGQSIPDFDFQEGRQLSTPPQSGIDNEADCLALNDNITRNAQWYEYEWVASGCYCAHKWKIVTTWNTPPSGSVVNPDYVAGSGSNLFITD